MSWIKTITYENAEAGLKRIYDRVKGPNDNVDNVLSIHSLRPHTLLGHMTLYKSVLHNSNNTLPKWFLEALGVYVSHLNKCDYCFDHHYAGFKRLYENEKDAESFKRFVLNDTVSEFFEEKEAAAFEHAKVLTLDHTSIKKKDIEELQSIGYSDGEILEINQVVSYFCYVNRMVVGLGVTTEGDIIGLSPNNSDEPDNWSHE